VCQEKNTSSYVIETNSVGARCFHEPTDTPSGYRKILFVGCSFTAGDGVANPSRFTDLLGTRFQHLHVHNYGLTGFHTNVLYENTLRLTKTYTKQGRLKQLVRILQSLRFGGSTEAEQGPDDYVYAMF
jgi:hypothetical protein